MEYFVQNKSRHPVRRSNSSPEMSSSWKNPFYVKERLDAAETETNDALDDNGINLQINSDVHDKSITKSGIDIRYVSLIK